MTNAGFTQTITLQLLLYKTTTCLMQPSTTFSVSQMKKKKLSKTTTTYKTLPSKEMENKNKAAMHKK